MPAKKRTIKDDGTPERVSQGKCPRCDAVGTLMSSLVFNVAVCFPCLLALAKNDGWI